MANNNNITGMPPWRIITKTFFFFFTLLLLSLHVRASETEFLLKVKDSLEHNDALSSWNPSTPPCLGGKPNWVGVLCLGDSVSGLKLENMGLKGVIDVESLRELSRLRTISFMDNNFEGTLPELKKISGLKAVFLSNNKFSGEIPEGTFDGLKWLKKIYLSNNMLTGSIPTSVVLLPKLRDLQLDGNQFTGSIPPFQQTTIQSISVANNQLHGSIPSTLSNMPASSFAGNPKLCGPPLDVSCRARPSILSIIVVVVVVGVALLVIASVVLVIIQLRNRQPSASEENPGLKNDDGDESRRSRSSQTSNQSKSQMKLSFIRNDREKFDLQELLRASAQILGSGCYSSSYKASLPNGPRIVVKRFKQMNNVGKEEFQEHMRRLGMLTHPNLLPLVAYYYRKEEKLLVTDFVENGSLSVRLHGHQALGEPSLDWPLRLKIVKGIAKGLEYLYKDMPSLIAPHGNLKSSNVLLTQSYEPFLCDYGLVPVINQDLVQDIMSIYKSPEYLQLGRITKKTDVWCLGILILEIVTGKFPPTFLQQGKGSEVSLANWVQSIVPEEWVNEVFDKDMRATKSSEGEIVKLLKIALACCEVDVDKRCDIKEAAEKIQEVKEREQDDDFFTSYGSEADADARSSRGLSGEINF